MEKNTRTNGSVCENCGKWMEHDHTTLTIENAHQSFRLCSERCDSEHRANLALRDMTWGTGSLRFCRFGRFAGRNGTGRTSAWQRPSRTA